MPKISDDKKLKNMNNIITNAKKLFIQSGYRDVTVEDICKKSGISKGAFYTYFKSKEALFLETAKESKGMELFTKETIFDKENSFEEVIIILWDMIFSEVTLDDIDNYRLRLEFWIESYDNDQLQNILKNKSDKSLNVFKDILKNYLNMEKISDEILNVWAIYFWSQAEGLMSYYTAHQRIPTSFEIKEIRKIVKNFINYITTIENK